MKENIILASLEVTAYRQDFKPKSGTAFEIFKVMNRELDLEPWLPWVYENNIELQFGYMLKSDTQSVIYKVWAFMTPEQATVWKLTWGHQNKVIM